MEVHEFFKRLEAASAGECSKCPAYDALCNDHFCEISSEAIDDVVQKMGIANSAPKIAEPSSTVLSAVKGILFDQLENLSMVSKDCYDECRLVELTNAMVSVAEIILCKHSPVRKEGAASN